MQDVMIFTPVYRLEPETVQALMAQQFNGALTLHLQRDNPTGDKFADHLHQYQRGREAFLAGPYDGLLVIESDIIAPPDALARLIALDCDIAFGCYVFRSSHVINIMERYYPWPKSARNMGESLTARGLWEAAKELGVVDCSGSGLGCILIKRHVIEQSPFLTPPYNGFFDWQWSQDTYQMGYRMKADTAVICGHKDVDGRVLWPS